ncbi:hypothetical protein [Brevundimonas naejangsanensis]|uniref:hypothetical protein n=1 Tax=Brevundimonas naejangsanensis TaxID=588932 RepID=UPI0039F6D900
MARKTIYCAQAFWHGSGGLQGGEVHQFLNRERAVEGGEALFTGANGVAVFSVVGYPDIDLWEEPRMLKVFGDVPAIDPDPPPEEVSYYKIDCSACGDIWTQIDPVAEAEQDEEGVTRLPMLA